VKARAQMAALIAPINTHATIAAAITPTMTIISQTGIRIPPEERGADCVPKFAAMQARAQPCA
jgi:hypothetical protein